MSKRSQESSSPGSPMVKAKNMLSRFAYLWEKIIRITPRSPGSTRDPQVRPGKKEIQNLDGIMFSMPRETESIIQKILEVS